MLKFSSGFTIFSNQQSSLFINSINIQLIMSKLLLRLCAPSNKLIFLISTWIAIVVYTNCQQQASCPQHCLDCEPGIGLCYACQDNYEADIFGSCHEPKIQNCVMYGMDSTCTKCRPTFMLRDGKCQKLFNGCLHQNGESAQQCWQCGFGMKADANKSRCIGVINCATYKSSQPNSQCIKCADGYELQAKDNKQICVDASNECSEKNPTNGLCTKCKEGYFYSGYQCVDIKYQTPLCYISKASGKCVYCKQGLSEYEGKCMTMKQMKLKFPGKSISVDGLSFKISSGEDFRVKVQDSQFNTQSGFILSPPGLKLQNSNSQSHQIFSSGINLLNSQDNSAQNKKSQKKQPKDTKSMAEILRELKFQQVQQVQPVKNKQFVQTEQQYKNNQLKNNIQSGFEQYSINLSPTKINVLDNQSKNQTQNQSPNFSSLPQITSINPTVNLKNNQSASVFKVQEIQPIKNKQFVQTEQQYKNNQLKNLLNFTNNNIQSEFEQYSINLSPTKINLADNQPKNQTININSNSKNNQSASASVFKVQQVQPVKNKSFVQTEEQYKNNQLKNNNMQSGFEQYSVNLFPTNLNPLNNQPKNQTINPAVNLKNNQSASVLVTANAKIQPKIQQSVQSGFTSSISMSQTITNQQPQQPYIPQQIIQPTFQSQQSGSFGGYSSTTSQFNIDYSNQNYAQNLSTKNGGGTTILNQQDLNCQQFGLQGQCQKCSTRYYVGSTGFCVPVHPLCKDHNQRGDCTGCYKGYSLQAGKCIITLQNDPYCKQFNGVVCTQCYNGYFYSQQIKQCKRLNPLCRTSNLVTGSCLTCYTGYNLNQNTGNCQVYMKDPNCKQYRKDNSQFCQACAQRFYVNVQTGTCSGVNPLCRDYDRSTGKCTICYPGYGLKDGQCIVGLVVDQYCKTLANGQNNICSQCFNGYYIGTDGRCKQANPLCRTFNPRNGYCTDCYLGYEVAQNGSCIVAVSRDENCRTFQNASSNYCTECYHGYLAINGKCQLQNPLCRTVNMSTGACASCWPGYSIDAVGINCIVSVPVQSVVSDPYCVKIQNSQCVQCSNGYFYSSINKKCQQLDLLCRTSDMSNGNCLSCYQGYFLQNTKCKVAPYIQIANCQTVGLSPNSVTQLVCKQCVQGYYLENGQCKLVSILCVGYDRSNGKCTGCIPGNFLQDGECIYPAIFDEHCLRYESSYCSRCRQGFFVSNFMCVPIDRNCHRFNYQNNTCQDCVNGLSPKGTKCE